MSKEIIHFGSPSDAQKRESGRDKAKEKDTETLEDVQEKLAPEHYHHPSGIQPLEIAAFESFTRGNIIKYVMRAPYGGKELIDMFKAATYIMHELDRLTGKNYMFGEVDDDDEDSDDD